MNDVLNKLLSEQVLSPETKQALATSIQTYVNEFEQRKTQEIAESVVVNMSAQVAQEQAAFMKKTEQIFKEAVIENLAQFKNDIAEFRNLEEEAKTKVANEIITLRETFDNERAGLVKAIAGKLDEAIKSAFNDFNSDIKQLKKQAFGQEIFEAFANEYNRSYHDGDSLRQEMSKKEDEIGSLKDLVANLQLENQQLIRTNMITECIKNVKGRTREELKLILEQTSTSNLQNVTTKYLAKVASSASTSKMIAENTQNKANGNQFVQNSVNNNREPEISKPNDDKSQVNDVPVNFNLD